MRISHRHRFVFLAKYKCASSAIRAGLDPYSDIKSSQTYPYYHHTPLAPLKKHFEEQGWDWDSYYVFTSVRHPVTMLKSLYAFGHPDEDGAYWWERHWNRVVAGENIEEEKRCAPRPASFREWVLTHDLSRFTLDPFIRDYYGEIDISRVVRFENLAQEMVEVCALLGLAPIALPRRKMGTSNGEILAFDSPMCARVSSLFQTDMMLGDYEMP